MEPISHDFARHVLKRGANPLTPDARAEMLVVVRDYLGVTLGGSQIESARIAARYQQRYGAAPAEASLLGHDTRLAAPAAAFANAVAAHSLDMDDTDRRSMLHMSAPVVSAALSVSEAEGSSGGAFLCAVRVGCDIMLAISEAANPGMRDRGFHSTAVCGVFGATAAAGLLLGLSEEKLVSAFGAAGAHAAGLFEIYGPTMQKSLHPGPAAQNGIVAARLAQFGFEGAPSIFDGKSGLFAAFAGNAEPDKARASLGNDGALGIEYKPYSCFRPIHSAIDCALDLRQQIADTQSIAAIRIVRHPLWAAYHLIPAPQSEQEAKGSLNHGIAVALVFGAALPEQYSAAAIANPDVRRISSLLAVTVDPSLPRGDSCRLEITLADGQTLVRAADFPRGSVERPLSEAEHEAKFRYLTRPLLKPEAATEIMAEIARLHSSSSIEMLMTSLKTAATVDP
ncbi:MAG TPA: MmgE/PrpD family protein [Devosia sp.]|nr:MmgE/PrpD family protein [Devosia sp.]